MSEDRNVSDTGNQALRTWGVFLLMIRAAGPKLVMLLAIVGRGRVGRVFVFAPGEVVEKTLLKISLISEPR